MDRIGVFTPEQAQLLWQDYQTRQQLAPQLRYNFPQRREVDEVSPHRVKVKNVSGEVIPAFACMRITGVEDVAGQTCITVEKPTSTDGSFLFNSHFEIAVPAGSEQGVGWAFRHGVVTMLGDEPTEPGALFGPIVGSWEIEEGGDKFEVFGRHDFSDRALVGRFAGGGGGGTHWIEFTIVDVYCPNDYDYDNEIGKGRWYIDAEVDWYSLSCQTAPPGFDSYTNTVRIFDTCILKFYTVDQLLGESIAYTEPMRGDAVYVYPFRTNDCVPEWHIKAICGVPSCGDSVSPPADEEQQ